MDKAAYSEKISLEIMYLIVIQGPKDKWHDVMWDDKTAKRKIALLTFPSAAECLNKALQVTLDAPLDWSVSIPCKWIEVAAKKRPFNSLEQQQLNQMTGKKKKKRWHKKSI